MADFIPKWTPGADYGPILTPLELYILDLKLEINPLLSGEDKKLHLAFNLFTSTYETDHVEQEVLNKMVDQPAVLPRTTEIFLITKWSPWVTKVESQWGVSVKDIMTTLHEQYTKETVTSEEFTLLPKRHSDVIRRMATGTPYAQNAMLYPTPGHSNSLVYRIHWLQGRHYFDSMAVSNSYAEKRLGYKAPNIFLMDLLQ